MGLPGGGGLGIQAGCQGGEGAAEGAVGWRQVDPVLRPQGQGGERKVGGRSSQSITPPPPAPAPRLQSARLGECTPRASLPSVPGCHLGLVTPCESICGYRGHGPPPPTQFGQLWAFRMRRQG